METKWVIEKRNDVTRVWWTGDEWSVVDTDALWYDEEPDARHETGEDAIAVPFDV